MKNLNQELKNLIEKYNLNCSIEEFAEKANWREIVEKEDFSEEFIDKYFKYLEPTVFFTKWRCHTEEFLRKYAHGFSEKTWAWMSATQDLSEEFIEEFKDKLCWVNICLSQKLSMPFIEKHIDKICIKNILCAHEVNENFIEKHKNKISGENNTVILQNFCNKNCPFHKDPNELREIHIQEKTKSMGEFYTSPICKISWKDICFNQKLSEDFMEKNSENIDWKWAISLNDVTENFIEKHKDKINFKEIPVNNKLSEQFMRKYQNELDWNYISLYQNLSKEFLEEFKDKINVELYNASHEKKSYKQKLKEVKEYASTYDLKIDNKYLYAYRYRSHNMATYIDSTTGTSNPTIKYKKGIYYKDWHCDMRKDVQNTVGYSVISKGCIPVRVKIEDWGVMVDQKYGIIEGLQSKLCSIKYDEDRTARVWGFEII